MRLLLLTIWLCLLACFAHAQPWRAKWVCNAVTDTTRNSFFAYRKTVTLPTIPATAVARISTDTKYWLWINGKLVMREGGLKRGPNSLDTYYDEIDIASYLVKGDNIIAVMVWYLGIDGISHKSSGHSALFFDCQTSAFDILSDNSWQSELLTAYRTAAGPLPNFRLSESNILFDASKDIGNWQQDLSIPFLPVVQLGDVGMYPWHNLVKRDIPFWKNDVLKNYTTQTTTSDNTSNTIIATLPYNAQVTPYFKIEAPAGASIVVYTDNYKDFNGGEPGMRFEYMTKQGIQEFETPAWLNGHKVYYVFPKTVTVSELKYRETGYAADFDGSFTCNDLFFTTLWQKAARTLYVNMRDGYMDCPDRERAQWPADAVHESMQSFYALSTPGQALSKKWLQELLNWRRDDGTLYGPVPGTWILDLPDQTLSAIGYGLWNYYMHTGDLQMINDFYPAIIKYLSLWDMDENGLVRSRPGYAFWGDRTDQKDIRLIINAWYYMTLQCVQQSALALNKQADYLLHTETMKKFREAFNQKYWKGNAYRDPLYTGLTDDRSQALAVVAGLADQTKYSAILDVLKKEEHASTYMEKFVMEALFMMGNGQYALERQKKRFTPMVNDNRFTTLWEDWSLEPGIYGTATVNHAWSGGGLVVLSQYLAGIAPLEPGYKKFQLMPQPANITTASVKVPSIAGTIQSSYELSADKFSLNAVVPAGAQCVTGIENTYERILVNGNIIWENGMYKKNAVAVPVIDTDSTHIKFLLQGGSWNILAITFPKADRYALDLTKTVTTDTTLCKNDTLVLSQPADKLLLWYKNDTLLKNSNRQFLNVWDSGRYYAVRQGSTDTSRKYVVRFSNGITPAKPSIQLTANKELITSADAGIQWYRNEMMISGATGKTYKPIENGNYKVHVKKDGCPGISREMFYLAKNIFEIDEKQSITLFPNPVSTHINIMYTLNSSRPVQLAISNLSGTRLKYYPAVQSGEKILLDWLNHGIYIITVTTPDDNKQYSMQLIK